MLMKNRAACNGLASCPWCQLLPALSSRMFQPSWWPRPYPSLWRWGDTGSSARGPNTVLPSRLPSDNQTVTTWCQSGARLWSSALAVWQSAIHRAWYMYVCRERGRLYEKFEPKEYEIRTENRSEQKWRKKIQFCQGTKGSLAFQSSTHFWTDAAPLNSADYAMEHLQQLLDKAKGSAGRLLKFSVFYRNQHPEYFDYVRYVLQYHMYSRCLQQLEVMCF